jgi:raffinose/stachyose/melibiose transport system substrate-binding protein
MKPDIPGWPVQIFSRAGFRSFVLPAIGGMDGVRKLRENLLRISENSAIRDLFLRQFDRKAKGYSTKNLLAGTYEMKQEALAKETATMAFQADSILPFIADKYPAAVDSKGFLPLPSDDGP